MRWMHPVVLLNGNNRLTGQPVVLWLLIKPEMFMQVQVQPFILLNRINVTEQATFALKDQVLYATLKNGGLVAVDMTNGTKKWTYPTTKGDAYFPIADKNGNVYFTEKGSQTVHAVNASGSKIWEKNVGNNLNYSGGALSTDGILYIGTQSNNKVLGLDITNGNIVFEETVGQQVMAAVSIDRSDLIISVR